jgi:hypothetical protein
MGPEGATDDLVAELSAGRERLNEIQSDVHWGTAAMLTCRPGFLSC